MVGFSGGWLANERKLGGEAQISERVPPWCSAVEASALALRGTAPAGSSGAIGRDERRRAWINAGGAIGRCGACPVVASACLIGTGLHIGRHRICILGLAPATAPSPSRMGFTTKAPGTPIAIQAGINKAAPVSPRGRLRQRFSQRLPAGASTANRGWERSRASSQAAMSRCSVCGRTTRG
jgi:hypothetical protein